MNYSQKCNIYTIKSDIYKKMYTTQDTHFQL